MHYAWITSLHASRARRSHVVMLALALCIWLVASAAHAHEEGGKLPASEHANACSLCLSLPAGAPAPSHAPAARLVLIEADAGLDPGRRFTVLDVPSYYLSRGPPAR